jgi:hypothetical protein
MTKTHCHCEALRKPLAASEAWQDAAIQASFQVPLDCFTAFAMTKTSVIEERSDEAIQSSIIVAVQSSGHPPTTHRNIIKGEILLSMLDYLSVGYKMPPRWSA